MTEPVAVTRDIAAPAGEVWALVSDLPRMGEWSNENTGGRWLDGATGPARGATFSGSNRRGFHRWKTKVTVVDSVPGAVFRFTVASVGLPVSEWAYEVVPTADGCIVTETWIDRRPGWFRPISALATGVKDRAQFTRVGMGLTLERIAATAEPAAP